MTSAKDVNVMIDSGRSIYFNKCVCQIGIMTTKFKTWNIRTWICFNKNDIRCLSFFFAFHKSSRFLCLSSCRFEFPNDAVIIVTSSCRKRRNVFVTFSLPLSFCSFFLCQEKRNMIPKYVLHISLMPSLVTNINPMLQHDEIWKDTIDFIIIYWIHQYLINMSHHVKILNL